MVIYMCDLFFFCALCVIQPTTINCQCIVYISDSSYTMFPGRSLVDSEVSLITVNRFGLNDKYFYFDGRPGSLL